MTRRTALLLLAAAARAQEPSTHSPAARALAAELNRIERDSGGQLGVAALYPEKKLRVGWRATEPFPLGALYHLPVAIRALALMQAGLLPFRKWVKVEPESYRPGHSPIRDRYPEGAVLTIGQLLRYAVSDTDTTAGGVLLELTGGADGLRPTIKALVKDAIRIDAAQSTATPLGYTQLLTMVHHRQLLQPKPAELLVTWLQDAPQGTNRLKALLPEGVHVWHIAGTAATKEGAPLCTNDAGAMILPDKQGAILLSVFLKGSPKDEAAKDKAVAQAARAVYQFLTTPAEPQP